MSGTVFRFAPPTGWLLVIAVSGTLMGITNSIATIPGFVGPSVVGALTDKNVGRLAFCHVLPTVR